MILSPSERCLLMWMVTKASRLSRRDMGRRMWMFPDFGIGVMEKRLVDVGSMRWVRM